MELEIIERNSNPLLSRQEVHVVIKHDSDSTPKRNQVISSLSKELKAKKDLIIIDYLKNQYGKSETKGYAKIYDTKDSMKLIETIIVACPVVGVATSLGLGAMQIAKGIGFSFGTNSGLLVQILIISTITVLSTFSVVSGVDKGIKYLSILNMILAFILLTCILYFIPSLKALQNVGPTVEVKSRRTGETRDLPVAHASVTVGEWVLEERR